MKELYLKLIELLSEIPEIKFIEENLGQLQEENPPISYPAILITTQINDTDDITSKFQQDNGGFELLCVFKSLGSKSSITPEEQRLKALEYYDIIEKSWKKLQGYQDSKFESFSRKSAKPQNIRRGLTTIVQRFETCWRETAN